MRWGAARAGLEDDGEDRQDSPAGGGERRKCTLASGRTAKLRLAKPDGRVHGMFNGKAGWTRRS